MRSVFMFLPVALLLLIAGGIGSARFMNTQRTIERSLIINTPVARVYNRLSHIRQWSGWYVPPETGRFEGPEQGPGGTLIVSDPESEEIRRLKLVETSSPSLVTYTFPQGDLSAKSQLPFDIKGSFHLVPHTSTHTRIISRQKLTAKTPDSEWVSAAGERWFLYIFADFLVGSVLERELHNLKGALESPRVLNQ